MKYLHEIEEIVNEYKIINSELSELDLAVKTILDRKAEVEAKLKWNRAREVSLIDKIVRETGNHPDYLKIMQMLNEPRTQEAEEIL